MQFFKGAIDNSSWLFLLHPDPLRPWQPHLASSMIKPLGQVQYWRPYGKVSCVVVEYVISDPLTAVMPVKFDPKFDVPHSVIIRDCRKKRLEDVDQTWIDP